jgi:hypothetical protein
MIRNKSAYALLGLVYLSLSAPAHAYLDGATGSLILQALIGGAATAMMFGRIHLARAKAFVRRGFSRSGSADQN